MATRLLSCLIALTFVLSSTGPLLAVQPPQQPPTSPAATAPTQAVVSQALRTSPIMFIENMGQFADGARFQVRGGNGTMWLAEDALWITIMARDEVVRPDRDSRASLPTAEPLAASETPRTGVNIRLSFPGANAHPRIGPFDRLDTIVSYFLGNDPDKWRPDVPVWGGVRYVDLYPGVDLELTSEGGQMVQRLTVRPGADLAAVRLRLEGADAVAVDGDALRLSTATGEFTLPLLQAAGANDAAAVQPRGAQTFDVAAPFTPARGNRQSAIRNLQSGDLLYGTFLGGSSYEGGNGIAVDGAGSAYVTGYTASSGFPTTPGAFDTGYNGSSDAFVVKLNPAGSGLAYATFLGGSASDQGRGIAVDGAGSAYVTGSTASSGFPTTPGAFDTSFDNTFVVKLNPAGSGLAYATFLGGSDGDDEGYAIAVDGAGCAYVTGWTYSGDFPTTPGAFATSFDTSYYSSDAFVVKLNPAGSGLAYATFLGGNGYDEGYAIAVDGAGSAYVTGSTSSSDFPTTPSAFDTNFSSSRDAFVVKLNPVGSGLAYATFLGGSREGYGDYGYGIAVDGAGSAYVTGITGSSDFPTTPGAFDLSFNGEDWDAFVVKLNPAGSGLAYATFLGGNSYNLCRGIAVDGAGSAYVAGETNSSDFPTTPGAFDLSYNGGTDAFVVKLNPAGSGLDCATFLGGSTGDHVYGIAVGGVGSAYVTGNTYSSGFPTTPGAFDSSYNGSGNYGDAFVVKLAMGGGAASAVSGRVTDGSAQPLAGVTVSAGAGHAATTDGAGNYTLTGLAAGTYTLTPTNDGYTFAPVSRTVTVPPNSTGQDFVGTNQCASTTDTDGDGLLDGWEICGYDADGDGKIDVNLPALGANPLRKDIFVEADYMVQYGPCQAGTCVAHSHRPKDEAIARIVQAFADAPVSVSGGLPGIALHVDVSDAIPHQDTLQPTSETWNWSGFNRIKATYFDPRRERIFHYALFAHDLGSSDYSLGTSGLASRPGSDFVVALGQWANGVGNVKQQAGTFMHELGHNLGLRHGGDDDQNYEPNYLSIMNYSFQTDGLIVDDADGHFDYSRFGSIPPLDEHHLNETVGLNSTAINRYGTRYYCWPFSTAELFSRRMDHVNDPIDWDCLLGANGTDVQADINHGSLLNLDFTFSTLTGFEDWPALVYDGGAIGLDRSLAVVASAVAQNVASEELTFEVADQFYRPYAVTLGGAGDIVVSLGVTHTYIVTLTNAGALTATVVLSYTTGLGWFNLAAVPLSVTVAPSVSLSFPVTLTAPGNLPAEAITDSVTISATVQEAPLMGDSATWRAHLGPLAQYVMEPAWGTRPLTVTFTDTSVGTITDWLWDFGNGITSTLSDPAHTYAQSGVYAITLTVKGPDGTDSKKRQVIVAEPVGPLTDLAAAESDDGVVLTWTHGSYAVARYEVYRSTTSPYFLPDDPDAQKLADVSPPALGAIASYTDSTAFNVPPNAYFYVIVAVDRAGQIYPPSNRVGAFNFELTPGTP